MIETEMMRTSNFLTTDKREGAEIITLSVLSLKLKLF